MSKAKLKAISSKLKKASKAHAGQAKQIDTVISVVGWAVLILLLISMFIPKQ